MLRSEESVRRVSVVMKERQPCATCRIFVLPHGIRSVLSAETKRLQRNFPRVESALEEESDRDAWLLEFLKRAVDSNFCLEMNCTTCGAATFRSELASSTRKNFTSEPLSLTRLFSAPVSTDLPKPTDDFTLFQAYCLSRIRPKTEEEAVRRAAMLIIFDLNQVFSSRGGPHLDEILRGSWAGEILNAMRAHFEQWQKWRGELAVRKDPAFIEANRAQKKLARAERHAVRVGRGKMRYEQWLNRKKT